MATNAKALNGITWDSFRVHVSARGVRVDIEGSSPQGYGTLQLDYQREKGQPLVNVGFSVHPAVATSFMQFAATAGTLAKALQQLAGTDAVYRIYDPREGTSVPVAAMKPTWAKHYTNTPTEQEKYVIMECVAESEELALQELMAKAGRIMGQYRARLDDEHCRARYEWALQWIQNPQMVMVPHQPVEPADLDWVLTLTEEEK